MTELVDAQFYTSLKTTLVPTNGAGTPAFTRATTKNIFDNEGNLISVKSGAVTLGGARVVQNKIPANPSSWNRNVSMTITSGKLDPDGGLTAYRLTAGVAGADIGYVFTAPLAIARYWFIFWLKRITGTGNITIYSDGSPITLSGVTTTWAKFKVPDNNNLSGALLNIIRLETSGDEVDLWHAQDVYYDPNTAQYIDSLTDYGAGSVGVKYFYTDSSGVAIPGATMLGAHIDPASKTNNLLYCRDLTKGGLIASTLPVRPIWRSGVIGSELVTNGTFNVDASGWSTLNCTLSAVSGSLRVTPTGAHTQARQAITTVAGKCYVLTFTCVDVNASTNGHVALVGSSTFGGGELACFSGDNSIGTPVSGIFKATGTTTYLTFYSPESTKYHDLDNISVRESEVQVSVTGTGIDGLANSCSLLTATAANATILQTITAAATAACSGFWVKRSVGNGNIFFTRNGGVDWIDITSLINSSTFTCVKIENTSVTNPQVGFKIATSGDAIIVDAGLNHAGTTLTLPILTTSAAVTRAADVLTYQTASNFSDTTGTILATYKPTYDTYAGGSIVGSSTRGLYAGTSNSGVQALDGTNTINGPTGTPSGQIRIGARWSGSSLQCFALDSFGSSGSYDGSFNLSTISILPGTAGYIRDLAIWTSSLTDNEISDAWNLITTYITSGSLVGMQSILSSSASSMSTVIYGAITATYVQPTLTATYTVPTIEAEP